MFSGLSAMGGFEVGKVGREEELGSLHCRVLMGFHGCFLGLNREGSGEGDSRAEVGRGACDFYAG